MCPQPSAPKRSKERCDETLVEGQRFFDLFWQSGVAQAVVATDGTITAVNAATCTMFGRDADEIVGHAILSQLPVEGRDKDEQRLRDLLSGRTRSMQFERRLPHQDGSHIDALVSLAAVHAHGRLVEIAVCLQDITALKAAQRSAERAEARWRSLAQNASDVALIADADLLVSYVSPALTRLLGYAEGDVVGSSLLSLVHPEDEVRVAAAIRRIVVELGGEITVECRVLSKAGDWRHVVQHVVNMLGDPDVLGLVANMRDQTDQHRLQASLDRAALEDPVTGLPSRALVMDRVQQAIEREHSAGQGYAMLFVNVDRLKAVNEAHGRSAGDALLRLVADTLCALVGSADTVGRNTTPGFLVLLDDVTEVSAVEVVAARVVAGLNMQVELGGSATFHVTACVGVAHGPASSADALISAAEAATQRAKALGRGRMYVLEDEAGDRIAERRVMSAELAVAVGDKRLTVHYQPIVELQSGMIVGFEALVRWPHPRLGLVGPDTFLPLAESLDLKVPIDEWVLREACRSARAWAEHAPVPVTVAVNVSPAHLTSSGFVEGVEAALTDSGLLPSLLVLEVTETAVVSDIDVAQKVLATLCELGVCISIDDFGTGYSSMLQLRQLPFSKLKIDREFVRGLPHSADDIAICASVIGLADRLGVGSIAEGIEDEQQAGVLAGLGCQLGQGFFWSAAVDRDAALGLLVSRPWATTPPVSGRSLVSNPLDEDAFVVARARSLHDAGASLHTIAAGLNRGGYRTRAGRRWHPATIALLLYQPRGVPV
jgi:diguanylate cyclase (GGDEF)-like protein/PAS domain S-box-containing protein